jgi:hypothetical protein
MLASCRSFHAGFYGALRKPGFRFDYAPNSGDTPAPTASVDFCILALPSRGLESGWFRNPAGGGARVGEVCVFGTFRSRGFELVLLDDIDKGTRSHLLDCMDHLVEIEAWRKTRSATERLEWASPRSVLRHWRASVTVAGKQAPVTSPVAALKARIVELEEEVCRLKKAEDEGGITLSRHDTSADVAKAIADMHRQQASKVRTLAHALLRQADSIEGKEPKKK